MTDMSLSNITSGRLERPLRIVIYGPDGVGKTCFAAGRPGHEGAPNPVFIATEDGTHHVNTSRFPVPNTWADIVGPQGALAQLYTQPHDFKTVVLDSIDWAEMLCDRYVVERYNMENAKRPVEALSDIPYGGWKALKMNAFMPLLDGLSALVRDRGMHVVVVAHADIKRFDDPERDSYDRYSINLFPPLAAKVREWSEYVLFANFDTVINEVGNGFNTRKVGASHGKRLIYSQRRAAYDAKARFNIPDRLELSWGAFWAAHAQAANNGG